MTDIKHIVIGLLVMVAGAVTLRYNFSIVNFTGNQEWIERRLGGGSTYGAYKFFSVLLVLTGVMYGSGLHIPFFNWLLSPFLDLFGGVNTTNETGSMTTEITN
jgi:hypothetical protein